MKNRPLISVIIPVYNVQAYVERCLLSIINCTYQNLEIICVNDGSTDNSLSILKSISDNRIKIFDKPNGGVSSARNIGLAHATGEFITFVDPDDWIHPQYFDVMMNAMINFDFKYDVIYCNHHNVNTEIPNEVNEHFEQYEILKSEDYFYAARKETYVWDKLFKKSITDDVLFDENISYCEDRIYVLMILRKCSHFVKIPNKLYYYYTARSGSLTHNYDLPLYKVGVKILEFVSDSNDSIALEEAYKTFFAHRYLHMFDENAKEEKRLCNTQLKQCRQLAKSLFSFKDKVKYGILEFCPLVYRLYRIHGDSTLLEFEKKRKQKLHEK